MENRMRQDILMGNLPLPSQHKFEEYLPNVVDTVKQMWSSLWHNYCANKGKTSTIYWLERAGPENAKDFLEALKVLQTADWVTIKSSENYSDIQLNEGKLLKQGITLSELDSVRFDKRFDKYLPIEDTSTQDGLAAVRVNGKYTNRKLSRPGMEKGAKSAFTFDRKTLLRHLDAVVGEANKGMNKVLAEFPELKHDEANYAEVVEEIVKYLAVNKVTCNMGINNVDSRGRAIKSALRKVMNPIGFKTARALVTIPKAKRKVATAKGMDAILLFVGELNGYKSGNAQSKLEFGTECWLNNILPHELHEAMWCERLYKELYAFEISKIEGTEYKWKTPIELDQAASVLQTIGILLGDAKLLTATNVLSDGTLNDPWGLIPTVNRGKGKKVLMRQIYGSNQSAADILDAFDDEYTAQEIIDIEEGINTGAYGVANALKRFIIGNCNLSDTIYPVVWEEQLEVPCNRHHVHGEKPVVYSVPNDKGYGKLIHWNTVKTPDLKSFKRWTMTGLCHSLDSRYIDRIMEVLDWGIDIHDAVICNPEDGLLVRSTYAQVLVEVHRDRESILNDYFASVGIKATPKVKEEWAKLKQLITPLPEDFKPSMWAMK